MERGMYVLSVSLFAPQQKSENLLLYVVAGGRLRYTWTVFGQKQV